MSYNRARLLLGMASVGTWVMLATWLLRVEIEAHQLLGVCLAVSLPFDLLGGQILPQRFSQTTPPFGSWLSTYLRSLAVHTAILAGSFRCLHWASQYGVLVPTATLLLVALIFFQSRLARLGGAVRFAQRFQFEGREAVLAECSQPGFTGGVAGLPGSETILIPADWSEEVREVAVCRRKLAVGNGARSLGLLVGGLWNLTGLYLLAPSGAMSSVQVAHLSLSMTLWTFMGLLLLPRIARIGVRWMDTQTLRRVGWPAFQTYLDAMCDETRESHPFSEPVFYPIPSRDSRLGGLQRKKFHSGVRPWHPARQALYLSVGCSGLLSRAVHCNAGRPALWFFPPCD